MSVVHEVAVRAVPWTGPDATALREAMNGEIGPRYADVRERRGPRPEVDPETVLVTLVAYDGATPVATTSLRYVGGFHEVKRVFVVASHRRRGLAARLLGAVEEHARAAGVDEVVLQTGARQPEAQSLYEREGWRRIPPFGEYVGDELNVCYAKEL